MTIFERIKELSKKSNISVKELALQLGFSENLFYRWKTTNPKAEDLAKVADYFNVSVDYLLGRGEGATIVKFSDDLENSIENAENYSGKPLSDTDKQILRGVIEAYLKNRDGNKE